MCGSVCRLRPEAARHRPADAVGLTGRAVMDVFQGWPKMVDSRKVPSSVVVPARNTLARYVVPISPLMRGALQYRGRGRASAGLESGRGSGGPSAAPLPLPPAATSSLDGHGACAKAARDGGLIQGDGQAHGQGGRVGGGARAVVVVGGHGDPPGTSRQGQHCLPRACGGGGAWHRRHHPCSCDSVAGGGGHPREGDGSVADAAAESSDAGCIGEACRQGRPRAGG